MCTELRTNTTCVARCDLLLLHCVCGLAQTGNQIGDAGAAALAPALGRLVQLQALGLSGKSRLPLRFHLPRSSEERV